MRLTKSKINGILTAPSSKSIMVRAVLAGLLAKGRSVLFNPCFCKDGLTAINIAKKLGAKIIMEKDRVIIKSKGLLNKSKKIQCKESGLCIRMTAPIMALLDAESVLEASGSLKKRPMDMVSALSQLGAFCKTDNGFPPLRIRGPIKGGKIKIDGGLTSQFLSGLLMALPLCKENSIIEVSNLKSRPYVKTTILLLKKFGIEIKANKSFDKFYIKGNQKFSSSEYYIEGDWSSSAFLLVAGAIGGKIKVYGLDIRSSQADKKILQALKKAGAKIKTEKKYIAVEKNKLNGFEFNAEHCPDLFPPLVVLAANCKGKTTIYGAERLKHKESNRAEALFLEFKKLGIDIKLIKNKMEITGGRIKGGNVESHNDHRIAMACAIASINAEKEIKLKNSECIAKSYPNFFTDLKSLKINSGRDLS